MFQGTQMSFFIRWESFLKRILDILMPTTDLQLRRSQAADPWRKTRLLLQPRFPTSSPFCFRTASDFPHGAKRRLISKQFQKNKWARLRNQTTVSFWKANCTTRHFGLAKRVPIQGLGFGFFLGGGREEGHNKAKNLDTVKNLGSPSKETPLLFFHVAGGWLSPSHD